MFWTQKLGYEEETKQCKGNYAHEISYVIDRVTKERLLNRETLIANYEHGRIRKVETRAQRECKRIDY